MGIAELITAALSLSADAFTVAVCKGSGMKRRDPRYALLIAAFFGVAQALMPILGWLLGTSMTKFIAQYDHWVAFILLSFVGGKMIYDSLHEETEVVISSSPDYRELFALAVATSIDAMAIGVTFAFLDINIVSAALLIGTVTFCLSLFGVYAGCRFRMRSGAKLSSAGGAVLIILGLKILLFHTALL